MLKIKGTHVWINTRTGIESNLRRFRVYNNSIKIKYNMNETLTGIIRKFQDWWHNYTEIDHIDIKDMYDIETLRQMSRVIKEKQNNSIPILVGSENLVIPINKREYHVNGNQIISNIIGILKSNISNCQNTINYCLTVLYGDRKIILDDDMNIQEVSYYFLSDSDWLFLYFEPLN